ncbi:MAG: hypothetical protein GKR94_04300 [Gammaproteobacteria bacterium]|nr:hypothetical protein [Gammaproteobacteria bacterium]
MKRRQALRFAALPLLLATPSLRAAEDTVDYSRELYDKLLAQGKPFLLDFYAPW